MTKLEIITADELCTPIIHETTAFGYVDENGDLIDALGIAKYFDTFTVITHNGSLKVAKALKKLRPEKIRFLGEEYEVEWVALSKLGYPRCIISHGYKHFYKDGYDGRGKVEHFDVTKVTDKAPFAINIVRPKREGVIEDD